MADVEEPIEISLLVPLGFIILSVLSASWGKILIRLVRGDKPEPKPAAEPVAEGSKKTKSKGKKTAQTTATVAAPAVPTPAAGNEKWKALLLVVGWILFFVFLASDYGMGQISTGRYDPYKVLNVPESITKKDLSRLYRDLSKEYHPDRLSGKPEAERKAAEARFMQISKAYKTLTTEDMMNNWIQYGHPDGPRSLSMSTGLPSWMTKQENAWFIMLFYLATFFGIGYVLKSKLTEAFADQPDEDPKQS